MWHGYLYNLTETSLVKVTSGYHVVKPSRAFLLCWTVWSLPCFFFLHLFLLLPSFWNALSCWFLSHNSVLSLLLTIGPFILSFLYVFFPLCTTFKCLFSLGLHILSLFSVFVLSNITHFHDFNYHPYPDSSYVSVSRAGLFSDIKSVCPIFSWYFPFQCFLGTSK